MQGAFDSRTVVVAEVPDTGHGEFEILPRNRILGENDRLPGEARLRLSAQVEHDLQQLLPPVHLPQRRLNPRWQRLEEQIQIVRDFQLRHMTKWHRRLACAGLYFIVPPIATIAYSMSSPDTP